MRHVIATLIFCCTLSGCDQQPPVEKRDGAVRSAPVVLQAPPPKPRRLVEAFDAVPKIIAGPLQRRCHYPPKPEATVPLTEGPFRFERAICHSDDDDGQDRQWLPEDVSQSGFAPYVDGQFRNKAVQHDDMGEYLAVSRFDGSGLFYAYLGAANRDFLGMGDEEGALLSWSSDGSRLRTVRQRLAGRFGFRAGPLEPISIGTNRRISKLPAPKDGAGPLDAIHWIGSSDLALAEFGTRGGYYAPQHEDRNPTLGIVDTLSGKVMDRMVLSPFNKGQPGGVVFAFDGIDAVKMSDGRVTVLLLQKGKWIIWKQGEAARIVPHPYGELIESRSVKFKLTPDGSAIVVTPMVRVPRPIPPPPSVVVSRASVEIDGKRYPKYAVGIGVALHDTISGKLIWGRQIRVSVNADATQAVVAPRGDILAARFVVDATPTIALFRASDGALLQTLPSPHGPPNSSQFRMMFSADGQRLAVVQGTATIIYARN